MRFVLYCIALHFLHFFPLYWIVLDVVLVARLNFGTVTNFCKFNGLTSVWSSFSIDFTYASPGDTSFSTLDHFLFTKGLEEHLKDAGVIHSGENISGHSPIFLEISTKQLPKKKIVEANKSPKQDWKQATQKDKFIYKKDLNTTQQEIKLQIRPQGSFG